MKRWMTYAGYVAMALPVAGLFGAVHDQISYSVSVEYFTRFKFEQFHLTDTAIPARVRVALIGFLASWWMGIPLGLLSGVSAFALPAAHMRRVLRWTLVLQPLFVLAFALAGLVYGYAQTRVLDMRHYLWWYLPDDLSDVRAFLCAGYMHNAAYMGGALAIPLAWIGHFAVRWRLRGEPVAGPVPVVTPGHR